MARKHFGFEEICEILCKHSVHYPDQRSQSHLCNILYSIAMAMNKIDYFLLWGFLTIQAMTAVFLISQECKRAPDGITGQEGPAPAAAGEGLLSLPVAIFMYFELPICCSSLF